MEVVEKLAKDKNLQSPVAAKKATKSTIAAATTTPAAEATTSTNTKTSAATKIAHASEVNVAATETDAANSKATAANISTSATASTVPSPAIIGKEMAATNATAAQQQKASAPAQITETISISDDDEDDYRPVAATRPPSQPSTVMPTKTSDGAKKRKSIDSATISRTEAKAGEEERYRLKRRKIKVAGAPKMPLTGYVRYMNDRREILRKEQPNKTAMDHTKLIGEEWNQLTEDLRAPYMKAAAADKERYLSELHVFLKANPEVLACELAKNKSRKSIEPATAAVNKSMPKDKLQANSNSSAAVKDTKIVPAKQLTKDDLAISTATTKARSATHTRRLSVNYTLPTHLMKEAATHLAMEKQKPKTYAAAASAAVTAVQPVRKRTPTPPYNSNNNNINNTNNNNNNHTSAPILATPMPGEIPIFTNEFLEHNKTFDMELRTLRKSKADLEQQNAVLEKHVENMKFGVEKMANENDELQEKNRLLEIYLDKLKRKLANALSGLAIPSEPHGATVDNIDKYMNDLYKMSTSNTHGPASLNKAKDIIRKLDLQIQL